jgi:hypothetical protein
VQWVSTFACGAPSLGRPRCLTVHPAESGPPSPQGTFGENSPHLLGNIETGKSKKKSLRHRFLCIVPLACDTTPWHASFEPRSALRLVNPNGPMG